MIILLLLLSTICTVSVYLTPKFSINSAFVQKTIKKSKVVRDNLSRSVVGELSKIIKSKFSNRSHQFESNGDSLDVNYEVQNKQALSILCNLFNSTKGWKTVVNKGGVSVERKFLAAGPFVSKRDAQKGSKHACVRSSGIIDCHPDKLFYLFQANHLVPQYNEHVKEMKDLLHYPSSNSHSWTKISWSSGPAYGPFKARDFVSVVNYQKFSNGTYLILNRPAYHPKFPPTAKYVRATILLAGSMLQPHGVNGQQTLFTQIAHVNPGGGADTPAVAWMINKLCAVGPPAFMRKLEKTAKSLTFWTTDRVQR